MTTIAIPDQLGAELQAIAERTGQSRDEYAARAIASFLEDQEDIALAKERLEGVPEIISLQELKKNLGLDT